MKKLFVLSALLLGLLSTANTRPLPTQDSDWSKISSDRRIFFELPQYALSYGYFMRAGSVCVDGEILRSKKAVKKCIRWSHGRDNDRCLKYEMVRPSKAMEGTRSLCVRWGGGRDGDCTEYRDFPYSIKSTFMISVHRKNMGGGRDRDDQAGRLLFKKNYTLATCN